MLDAHTAVFDALSAGDGDTAEHWMRKHFADFKLFEFEATHRQRLAQVFRREGMIDVLFEPVERYSHYLSRELVEEPHVVVNEVPDQIDAVTNHG